MSTPTPPGTPPGTPPTATPTPPPVPAPRSGSSFVRVLTGLLLLLLAAAAGGGAAWAVVEWRLAQADLQSTGQIAALKDDLARRQDEVNRQLQRVEQAVADARLVVGDDTLAEKLAEIDQLKEILEQERADNARRMEYLEQTLRAEIGAGTQETAAAVARDLQLRSLLQQAEHRVLKAKLDLAEENRGLARDELTLALETLQRALEESPPERQGAIEEILVQLEEARTALVLGASTARTQLDLVWNRLNEFVTQS